MQPLADRLPLSFCRAKTHPPKKNLLPSFLLCFFHAHRGASRGGCGRGGCWATHPTWRQRQPCQRGQDRKRKEGDQGCTKKSRARDRPRSHLRASAHTTYPPTQRFLCALLDGLDASFINMAKARLNFHRNDAREPLLTGRKPVGTALYLATHTHRGGDSFFLIASCSHPLLSLPCRQVRVRTRPMVQALPTGLPRRLCPSQDMPDAVPVPSEGAVSYFTMPRPILPVKPLQTEMLGPAQAVS